MTTTSRRAKKAQSARRWRAAAPSRARTKVSVASATPSAATTATLSAMRRLSVVRMPQSLVSTFTPFPSLLFAREKKQKRQAVDSFAHPLPPKDSRPNMCGSQGQHAHSMSAAVNTDFAAAQRSSAATCASPTASWTQLCLLEAPAWVSSTTGSLVTLRRGQPEGRAGPSRPVAFPLMG